MNKGVQVVILHLDFQNRRWFLTTICPPLLHKICAVHILSSNRSKESSSYFLSEFCIFLSILQLNLSMIIDWIDWKSGCICSYITSEIHSEFDYCVSIFPPLQIFDKPCAPETLSDSLKE